MVIGGIVTDEDLVTPFEGDVATMTKVATNPQCYEHCEQQLFANMCLSATDVQLIISDGTITPKEVE